PIGPVLDGHEPAHLRPSAPEKRRPSAGAFAAAVAGPPEGAQPAAGENSSAALEPGINAPAMTSIAWHSIGCGRNGSGIGAVRLAQCPPPASRAAKPN